MSAVYKERFWIGGTQLPRGAKVKVIDDHPSPFAGEVGVIADESRNGKTLKLRFEDGAVTWIPKMDCEVVR